MKKERKEAIKKELQELESRLDTPGSASGFRIPENYFDSLPGSIQEKVLEKTSRPALSPSGVLYRRVVPVLAAVVLLAGIVFSLFIMRSDNEFRDHLVADDLVAEFEYLAFQPGFDHGLLYDVVAESGLTAEEILYDLDTELLHGENDYDEVMESMFENARYYGIENSYLLSSLD